MQLCIHMIKIIYGDDNMSNAENINANATNENKPFILAVNEIEDIDKHFDALIKKHGVNLILYLPFMSSEELDKLKKELNNMTPDEFKEYIKGKNADVVNSNIVGSNNYINRNNVYGKTFTENKDNVTNNIVYGENDLSISTARLKEGNNSVENTELLLCKAFGLGEMINVPLWNSGFWVRLKPVTPTELVSLEVELAKSNIDLGKDTLGLVHSNENVIYTNSLSLFIKDHISNTNLALPAGEDIRDYINTHDYYTLLLAILTSIYPNGAKYNICCSNYLKKDVKCEYSAEVKVDMKKLLWVNRSKITTEMFNIMCNKKPNSVTIDMAKEYQRLLQEQLHPPKEYTIKLNNDVNMIVGLKVPSLLQYVNKGSEWVNSIISKYFSLSGELTSKNDKTTYLNSLIISQLMCIYSPYVSYIRNEEDTIRVDNYEAVLNMLKKMDIEGNVYNEFVKGITEFIDSSSVSIIATPNYTCPNCKKDHSDATSSNKDFKEFIPLNMLHYFFILSALKTVNRIENIG